VAKNQPRRRPHPTSPGVTGPRSARVRRYGGPAPRQGPRCPGDLTRDSYGAEPLTAVELRVLKLLPTSTYPQIAAALYVSRGTVKTHLQSVYHKLGVASRAEAIERAIDLRLL
jgi:ATP/maltotriose-dependent transcriptional regulator MalT